MNPALQTAPISFEEFVAWYPDHGRRYELIEGSIVEVLPTGPHEDIAGLIGAELNFEIRRQGLPYSIPRNCLIRPRSPGSGYIPDVVVLNRASLPQEPLWSTASVVQSGDTIALVVEVVITNWRDDYDHKFVEYEAMGIAEYWIVDFRALGAVRHVGKPKQPTITMGQWVEGEYQLQRFLAGETLVSRVFPELNLTVDAIFAAAD